MVWDEGFKFFKTVHLSQLTPHFIHYEISPLSATLQSEKEARKGYAFLYLQFFFPHIMGLIPSSHYSSSPSLRFQENMRCNLYYFYYFLTTLNETFLLFLTMTSFSSQIFLSTISCCLTNHVILLILT